MRLSGVMVLGLVVMLASGCGKKGPEPGKGTKAAGPRTGPELSKVEGVSIRESYGPLTFADGATAWGASVCEDNGTAVYTALPDVIIKFCQEPGRWLLSSDNLPGKRYDVTAFPAPGETIWPRAKRAFEQTFGIRIVERTEKMPVVVIQKGQETPAGLEAVKPDFGPPVTQQTPGGFGWVASAATMEDLANVVLKYKGVPVLDETGLDGYYRFTLSMDHWHPETLDPAIEKLGLKLVRTEREIPVLRVLKAPPEGK